MRVVLATAAIYVAKSHNIDGDFEKEFIDLDDFDDEPGKDQLIDDPLDSTSQLTKAL